VSYKPVNRMIVVNVSLKEEETQTVVLLPEGVRPPDRYGSGTVESIASDCKIDVSEGDEVVFENSMLQTVTLGDEEVNMLLENYVLAVASE